MKLTVGSFMARLILDNKRNITICLAVYVNRQTFIITILGNRRDKTNCMAVYDNGRDVTNCMAVYINWQMPTILLMMNGNLSHSFEVTV